MTTALAKHPATVRFTGRMLYLAEDPALVAAQLAGRDLAPDERPALRDNISTDEITPVTVMFSYDEELGRFPYVGFETGGERPIRVEAVRRGGFGVTIAGKRYGKGSSRESSPLAEYHAGIRLIIAESFERIYRQNCDNIGILTSTDFSLLDRIAAGEAIPLEVFLDGRDNLTRQIIQAGGLLAYSRNVEWPQARAAAAPTRPRTIVEKILERRLYPRSRESGVGDGVFLAADWRFSHDYFTGMVAHVMHGAFGEPASLHRPDRIVAFRDHLSLAGESLPHRRDGLLGGIAHLLEGHDRLVETYPVRAHGALDGAAGSEGICHALMTERYALPGEVVIGTDSHTPHSGALGCFAFGVGATDMALSWVTGYVRCTIPETLRVEIDGHLRAGVTAKDVMLHLLQMPELRGGRAIGCVVEFAGSAVTTMSVDERATLTNMVAELGGLTGIVAPDAETVRFLRERRGVEITLDPWMQSDAGASYRSRIHIDADALSPMVARPGDPGNGIGLGKLQEPVRVDIAYGGSCTAGKQADFDAYHEVLEWGERQGLSLAKGTRLYLQFGTVDVMRYCDLRGYTDRFRRMGATILMPGCGACANCGPGQSETAAQVTISAINRNFPGRSGPGQVWLASPFTVAASALAGRIVGFADLQATCEANKARQTESLT